MDDREMADMTTHKEGRKERNRILMAYELFVALMVFSFIPTIWAGAVASTLYVVVLITSYTIRRKAAPGSLTENHMTYLIRSLWIASFLAVITVTVGICYVLTFYDPSSLNDCLQGLMEGGADIESCATSFLDGNRHVLYIGGFIAAAPVAIYALWRLFRGGRAALRLVPVANVMAWL